MTCKTSKSPATKQCQPWTGQMRPWTYRLKPVLMSVCLIFMLFFGLDFLFTRLFSLASTQPGNQDGSREFAATREEGSGVNSRRFKSVFKLLHESELQLSEDQSSYVDPSTNASYSIQPNLRLARLLNGYHRAMPFDPDIWSFSEPISESMHLLSGDAELCLSHLEALLEELEALKLASVGSKPGLKHLRLMQLMDAQGRPEAGSLAGHPFWLGSYTECNRLSRVRAANVSHGLRYCVAKLSLKAWQREPNLSDEGLSIKVGACLPDSCDSLALFRAQAAGQTGERQLQVKRIADRTKQLLMYNFPANGKLYSSEAITFSDLYCLPQETHRPLPLGAFLLLVLLLAWMSGMVFASIKLHRFRRASKESSCSPLHSGRNSPESYTGLLSSIALDVNLERFFCWPEAREQQQQQQQQQQCSTNTKPRLVSLDPLDCLKHLGCMGVVAAHILVTYLSLGTGYTNIVESIGADLRTMLMLSLNNLVDTFFVISAIIASYLICASSASIQPKLWPLILAHRYLRLAPVYLVLFAWVKYVSVHMGSGPLWDYATSSHSLRGLCRQESWLWPISFTSNLKPLLFHCLPPAWSLAADLQFFFLLPPLLGLLNRRTKPARLLIGASVLISSLHTYKDYHALLEYVQPEDFAKLRLHVFTVMLRYAAKAYSQPHNRLGPFLIGVLAGHWLYQRARQCEARKWSKIRWPKWMRGRCLRTMLAVGLLLWLGPIIVQLRARFAKWQQQQSSLPVALLGSLLAVSNSAEQDFHLTLVGYVLIKPLWAAINALVILRLVTDLRQSLVGRLLSARLWRALARLNYCILLIHFELILYHAMSRQLLEPITWTQLLAKFAFAYLFSLLAALFVHLLLERPAQGLIRWLMLALKASPQPRRSADEAAAAPARATGPTSFRWKPSTTKERQRAD